MAEVKFNIPSLDGTKTYLCVIAGIGVVAAHVLGYISDTTTNTLLGLLGFGAIGALRMGVTKSGPEPIKKEVASMVADAINLQPPCKEPPNPTPTAVG